MWTAEPYKITVMGVISHYIHSFQGLRWDIFGGSPFRNLSATVGLILSTLERQWTRSALTLLSYSINLWEMAEFLLKQDVVNAINLDGGGSATFVLNGTLASYPSDHW